MILITECSWQYVCRSDCFVRRALYVPDARLPAFYLFAVRATELNPLNLPVRIFSTSMLVPGRCLADCRSSVFFGAETLLQVLTAGVWLVQQVSHYRGTSCVLRTFTTWLSNWRPASFWPNTLNILWWETTVYGNYYDFFRTVNT